MHKKRLLLLIEVVLALAALVLSAILIKQAMESSYRKSEEADAAQAMEQFANRTEAGRDNKESLPARLPQAEALLSQNEDFVGMVGFDDMALYVCQGSDNSYYASHRFNRVSDAGGMIYMDYRCSIWPRSDNIVLYGHNMMDGSRFGKLKRYANIDYLLANKTLRFATLYEIHSYSPIAVFYTSVDESSDDYFSFAQVSFEEEAEFDAYISAVRERSLFYLPGTVTYGDALLTLATCSSVTEQGRLVLVCRQMD